MSAQDSDASATTRPNQSANVAESNLSRPNDFKSINVHPTRASRTAQAAHLQNGFPKFKQLPAELRSKIWQHAMPPRGITYTALMVGREEPMPQQQPAPAPIAFRLVYHLEPVPRNQQDPEMRARLDAMRAIQRASTEAAAEVNFAFPTTIACTRGKLRFSAYHDRLSLSDLHSNLSRGIPHRFAGYAQGAVVFAGDWHRIPRQMTLDNTSLVLSLSQLDDARRNPRLAQVYISARVVDLRALDGFLRFLADCASLRTVGLTHGKVLCDWGQLDVECPWGGDVQAAHDGLRDDVLALCHPSPIMQGPFYKDDRFERSIGDLLRFVRGCEALGSLVRGLTPGQDIPDPLRGIEYGRRGLQHLRVRAVLPVSPDFHPHMQPWED
jgi:hypothetical protein